ncbi:MAG: hypothetical protein ACK53Y_13935, partial [bacterium]
MYQRPKASKMTLCEKRASMKLIAGKHQKKQGEHVNKKCAEAENYKHVLHIGDIGAVCVPPNVRGATDFPFLSVMVTDTKMSKTSGIVRYAICTPLGHLEGVYNRDMIEHDAAMTQRIVKIDPMAPGFKDNLTASASAIYNRLGGKSFCHYKSDCIRSKSCKCLLMGRLCRPKCHAPRKVGLPVHCSNCSIGNSIVPAEPH